jgi:hypothetical protein
MRRWIVVLAVVGAACAADTAPDNSPEWRNVLGRKRAAIARSATERQKQVYADALAAFITRYPSHSRAREVYRRVQLDFARELASLGRYQDAIRFYRAVLSGDPFNAEALHGLAAAADRLMVSRQKLLELEKGMSQREVSRLLGSPIPGWTLRTERPDCTIEAWYYRTNDRGVAGLYFRNGLLFGAEENSHAKLVPLTQPVAP